MYVTAILIAIPLLILLAIVDARRRLRLVRHAEFFQAVSFIVRQNLPMIAALHTSARGAARRLQTPLLSLSRVMETGLPLSDAVRQIWPTVPREDYSLIRAGENGDTLPEAMGTIEKRYDEILDKRVLDDYRLSVLPHLSLVFFALGYWGIGFFIVPKFRVIFADFDVAMSPFVTDIFTRGFSDEALPATVWGWLFHLCVWAIIVGLPLRVFGPWFVRQFQGLGLLDQLFDTIRWYFPITHRLAAAESCGLTLPIARYALSAGWPLPRAIDLASHVEVNTVWRGKLKQWHDDISGGIDMISAARRARFPAVLINYLAVAARDGTFDAPLYAAEEYYTALGQRRENTLRTLSTIGLTLVGAFIVGSFAVAMIESMANIIDITGNTWLDR